MRPTAPLAVAFNEVRHFQPDDCLHYEPIEVRGQIHGWTIPPHRHEGLHQFQLLERGRFELTIDGARHALAAPAALMVAPGAVHGIVHMTGAEGHQVTVPTVLLQGAFAQVPALTSRMASSLVLSGEAIGTAIDDARSLFAHLAREFLTSKPGRIEALRSQAVLLALWFLRRSEDSRPDDRGRNVRDTLVHRYRSMLELHFRTHQPLSFYADALQVGTDHLSRACRAATGLSALDLLHERVLLEARRLLAYTSAPVTQVALQLGFADPGYFSRFFSRRAGVAPSAYRQGLAQGLAVHPARAGHRRSHAAA